MRNVVVAFLLIVAIVVGAGAGYLFDSYGQRTNAPSTATILTTTGPTVTICGPFGCDVSSTTINETFTTNFYYRISINYSGSWNLVYWGTNGTLTPSNFTDYNVKGNLSGSGDYKTTIVTYGVGYVENTLCTKATRMSQQSTLTLTVLEQSNSTTASDPSAEVCVTYGV